MELGAILPYVTLLHFGVFNGLNRELPYYFGKGLNDEATTLAEPLNFGHFYRCNSWGRQLTGLAMAINKTKRLKWLGLRLLA